jgi:hypothetical protein
MFGCPSTQLTLTSIDGSNFFIKKYSKQLLHDRPLNNNKPVLQHVQTHKVPFSRDIAETISWSDVSDIPLSNI